MTEWDILTTSGKYQHRESLASDDVRKNALDLSKKVTLMLQSFSSYSKEVSERKLTSGFRDKISNEQAHGAKHSAHLEGKACDVEDTNGRLALFCVTNADLLAHFELFMEDPNYTHGWVHLQSRPVPGCRIFKP